MKGNKVNFVFILAVLLFSILGCVQKLPEGEKIIPNIEVVKHSKKLQNKNGILYLDTMPYSGYVIEKFSTGVLKSKASYWQGRKEKWSYTWFRNGIKNTARHYVNGQKVNVHKGWWPNGSIRFIFQYKNGVNEGEQLHCFSNGVLAQRQHYVNGREAGRQSMWNESGKIIANYVVKNNKRYGIVGRSDCVSVYKKED